MTTEEINALNASKRGTSNFSFIDKITNEGYIITNYSKFDEMNTKVLNGDNSPIEDFNKIIELSNVDYSIYRNNINDALTNITNILNNTDEYNDNLLIGNGIKSPVMTEISQIKYDLGFINIDSRKDNIKLNLNAINKQISELNSNNTIPQNEKMSKYKELITKRNNQSRLLGDANKVSDMESNKQRDNFKFVTVLEDKLNHLMTEIKNMNLSDDDLKNIIDYSRVIKDALNEYRKTLTAHNNVTDLLNKLGIAKVSQEEVVNKVKEEPAQVTNADKLEEVIQETTPSPISEIVEPTVEPEIKPVTDLSTEPELKPASNLSEEPQYLIFNRKSTLLKGTDNSSLKMGRLYKIEHSEIIDGEKLYKLEGIDDLVDSKAFTEVKEFSLEDLQTKYDKQPAIEKEEPSPEINETPAGNVIKIEPAEVCPDIDPKNHNLKMKSIGLMGLIKKTNHKISTGIAFIIARLSKKKVVKHDNNYKPFFNKFVTELKKIKQFIVDEPLNENGEEIDRYSHVLQNDLGVDLDAATNEIIKNIEIEPEKENIRDKLMKKTDEEDDLHQAINLALRAGKIKNPESLSESELKAEVIYLAVINVNEQIKTTAEGRNHSINFIKRMIDENKLKLDNKSLDDIGKQLENLANSENIIDNKTYENVNDKFTDGLPNDDYIQQLIANGQIDPSGKSQQDIMTEAINIIIKDVKKEERGIHK